MGQGQSIAGKLGKYAFEQNEESCLGRGSFGVVYKGRGPKVRYSPLIERLRNGFLP